MNAEQKKNEIDKAIFKLMTSEQQFEYRLKIIKIEVDKIVIKLGLLIE